MPILLTLPCSRGRSPETTRRSRSWWSRTRGRCSGTATGCSAPARTPRTPPRTRWSARGASWRPMTVRGRSAPGCSASRPTSVSTGCGPGGPGSARWATGRPRRPGRARAARPGAGLGRAGQRLRPARYRGTRRMRSSAVRRSAWPSWPRCSSWRPASAPRCCCTTCWASPTPRSAEVLEVSTTAVNSLLSRARESVRATAGMPQPDITEPRVQQLLERYVRAWRLADIDGFVRLVAEDVRFIMPPLTAWFDGREAVAAFVANAIFAPGPPVRGAAEGRHLQRAARLRHLRAGRRRSSRGQRAPGAPAR